MHQIYLSVPYVHYAFVMVPILNKKKRWVNAFTSNPWHLWKWSDEPDFSIYYVKYREKPCHNPNTSLSHATQAKVAVQRDQLKMMGWESGQQPSSFVETLFRHHRILHGIQLFKSHKFVWAHKNMYSECWIFIVVYSYRCCQLNENARLLQKNESNTHEHAHYSHRHE